MTFDKLEIIAKPAEDKADRWTVAWKANLDGTWYGQWIDIPDDGDTLMRSVLKLIVHHAFQCIEHIVQERELKGEE